MLSAYCSLHIKPQVMKTTVKILLTIIPICLACAKANQMEVGGPQLYLANLELIAKIDPRYQSYNIEMCEVVGGDFWIPYQDIDTARWLQGWGQSMSG